MSPETPTDSDMIRIQDLHKQYSGAARPALAGVDLSIPPGCAFGLLGPNGAGKTTLLSVLTGVLRADRGTIHSDGPTLARGGIGYAPQELAFYPGLSVRENLDLFMVLTVGADATSRDEACRVADLSTHLDKPAGQLSGGLKRRLNFAIGLLGRPRLLILDEPTAGVDPQSRNFLLDAVRRLRDSGVTVLYSTHYMEEIERLCDRVAILDAGRVIAEGPLDALRQQTDERLEAVFLRLTQPTLRDA